MSERGEGRAGNSPDKVPAEWVQFCAFIESHYCVIYTVALAHVRDCDVAQEITQDVCVRLLLERHKLPPLTNASGWLARVSRNTAIDWVRRQQTHSRILAMMESWKHDTTAGSHGPEDARKAAIEAEEKQQLFAALDKITPEDREILLMHYLDGLEKQEIARVLELHPSTVGRRMEKAFRELRKLIDEPGQQRLAVLRAPAHAGKGIIATLTAVAALGASEKAALAAAAAPLPLLSAGAGLGGSAAAGAAGTARLTALAKGAAAGWLPKAAAAALVIFGVWMVSARYLPEKTAADTPKNSVVASPTSGVAAATPKPRPGTAPVSRRADNGGSATGLRSEKNRFAGYIPSAAQAGSALSGTVRNESGEAIPNALVTLWTNDEDTSAVTTTGADGKFQFDSFPDGHSYVTVSAPGYASINWGENYLTLPVPAAIDMDLQLVRPMTMRGKVVSEASEPVGNARVVVGAEYSREKKQIQPNLSHDLFETVSDANGNFSFEKLKPGYATLVVQHPDYADRLASQLPVGDQTIVTLDHGVTLEGTVHDGEMPVAHADVKINAGAMSHRVFGATSTRTDSNGRFVVPNRPVPGSDSLKYWSYTISVENSGGAPIPTYLLGLKEGEGTHTVVMNSQDPRAAMERGKLQVNLRPPQFIANEPEPKGRATLEGTIVLPDDPASGTIATVRLTDNKNYYADTETSTGQFRFNGVPEGQMEVSCRLRYVVQNTNASAPANANGRVQGTSGTELKPIPAHYEPVTIQVRDGELHTLTLKPGQATVSGRVTNRVSGQKYYVSICTSDPLSPFYRPGNSRIASVDVDSDGSFKVTGLPAGEYQALVTGGTDIMSQAFEVSVTDTATLDIALPDAHVMQGTVIDSSTSRTIGGAEVMINGVAATMTNAVTAFTVKADENGNYTCRLTPGKYMARVSGAEHVYFQVTAADGVIPPIDMRQENGMIAIKKISADEGINFQEARFHFIPEDSDDLRQSNIGFNHLSKLDNRTVVAQQLKPGRYTVVVYYDTLLTTDGEPFGMVVVPGVEVREDEAAVVEVALEKSGLVKLQYEPGDHIANWKDPKFWIRDSTGFATPVSTSNHLNTTVGLSPGQYEFGCTLDSGEEQTVSFEVRAGVELTEVLLQLR